MTTEKEIRAVLKPMVRPFQDKIKEWREYAKKLELILIGMGEGKRAEHLIPPAELTVRRTVREAQTKLK